MSKSWQQKEADAAFKLWNQGFWLGSFRVKAMLIPLSILNRVHNIPHTNYNFSYRDVYVFGVRIIRYQVQ